LRNALYRHQLITHARMNLFADNNTNDVSRGVTSLGDVGCPEREADAVAAEVSPIECGDIHTNCQNGGRTAEQTTINCRSSLHQLKVIVWGYSNSVAL
jgi:hypothetical protein